MKKYVIMFRVGDKDPVYMLRAITSIESLEDEVKRGLVELNWEESRALGCKVLPSDTNMPQYLDDTNLIYDCEKPNSNDHSGEIKFKSASKMYDIMREQGFEY